MSNVLDDTKQQQVVALGRLGWSLRRIEQETAVRRETASGYLKAAGIPVRERGGRPREWPPKPATTPAVSTDLPAKPAMTASGVSTDPADPPRDSPGLTAFSVLAIDRAGIPDTARFNSSLAPSPRSKSRWD